MPKGTISEIRLKAPNAQILLVGYPEIFSRTVKCAGSWYFDGMEANALNDLGLYMRDKENAAVTALQGQGIKVAFADPTSEFGGHGACDSVEYVHKIVDGPTGPGDNPTFDGNNPICVNIGVTKVCISRSSFHPNQAGTAAYARVVSSRLSAIGYWGR